MTLPISSFRRFAEDNGVVVTLKRVLRLGPDSNNDYITVSFQAEVRGYFRSSRNENETIGGEKMPVDVQHFVVFDEELKRSGFPALPQPGDLLQIGDETSLVTSVEKVYYRNKIIAYRLVMKADA